MPAPNQPAPEKSNVAALRAPEEDEYGFPPQYSEDSLANKFTEKYERKLVYCGPWHKWLEWKGTRWVIDPAFTAINYARKVCREVNQDVQLNTELGKQKDRISSMLGQHKTFANVEKIAKSDPRHHVLPADFDADPWVLNTPDGIVDLKTGSLRPARRSDMVRKQTAVGPGGDCPNWMKFLKVATCGDEELQGYLKRVAGYCLTGSVSEHSFFFMYGTGGNGKGTFKEMMDWILADYAVVANIKTFTEQRFEGHSSDIALFAGARMVTANETAEGSRWAESKIKVMTGGDKITANHMHQDPFTFKPLFKLVFTGNFKPQLRSVDAAIRRRLYMVPFDHEVTEAEKDLCLDEKLQAEASGILSWMIEGCLEWRETTLKPPLRVRATTSDYLDSEDRIGKFLEENVVIKKTDRVKSALLFMRYKSWADTNNEYAISKRRFMEALQKKGFSAERLGGEQVVLGMAIT